MPLLDHFHPPLSERRQWHAFHHSWAAVSRLNGAAAPPVSNNWAAPYRPWQTRQEIELEIWHHALAVGTALPALPFWLKNGPCMKLDLDATYMRTLQDQRMLAAR